MYMRLYIYIYLYTYVCIYMCKHFNMSHLFMTVQVYNIYIPWALKVRFLRWPEISPRTLKSRMCVQTWTLVVLVDHFLYKAWGPLTSFWKPRPPRSKFDNCVSKLLTDFLGRYLSRLQGVYTYTNIYIYIYIKCM